MKPDRADFYDPLYDFVTFEEAAHPQPRSFFNIGFARESASTHGDSISPQSESKAILPFLDAVEFTRQAFLRQSDLAFLVYPSATHTRWAHSVGACYLGFIAAQRVAVNEGLEPTVTSPPDYLSKFLEATGLREEFYLALLLHDVGHFPFSHALENDRILWDAITLEIGHEEVACQLIQGQGPVYEATLRRAARLRGSYALGNPHLAEIFSRFPTIERDAVCYLISGDSQHLQSSSTKRRAQLRVIHELVSGLLDLDRIDHYRRDNYFTGLKAGSSVNYPSLLSGLTILFDPQNEQVAPFMRLSPSASGHAIALLQCKERLAEDCFEHPDNIAYEAMLHHAFNAFVLGDDYPETTGPRSLNEQETERLYDLLVSTDDELLCRMNNEGSDQVRENVWRIMNRRPFARVTKLTFRKEHGRNTAEVRDAIAKIAGVATRDVVLRTLHRFGKGTLESRSGEWLDLHRLQQSDGKQLVDGKHKRQIEHFKLAQESTHEPLWVFATAEDIAMKIETKMRDITRSLLCSEEDI